MSVCWVDMILWPWSMMERPLESMRCDGLSDYRGREEDSIKKLTMEAAYRLRICSKAFG